MDSSPSQTVSELERAGTQTHTRTRSWQLVVHSSSLKEIISHLLIPITPRVHQTKVDLKACDLLLDLQHLLCSSFPWVQVTEEKQEANSLLQPTAPFQVAEAVLGRLEQVFGPRVILKRALVSSQVLHHNVVHLVARSVAQLVPDQLSACQDDILKTLTVSSGGSLPATLTISSQLVEDLIIQLMLKLHPLKGSALSQQELLAVCLHMSSVTQETLRRVPGVAMDTELAPPLCNLRRSVLLIQSSLIKKFGPTLKLKILLAVRDPALLSSIPNCIMEAVLTVYQSISQAHPAGAPIQAPRGEDEMEKRPFPKFPKTNIFVKRHAVSSSGSEGKHKKIDVYDFGPLLPPPPAQPGADNSAAVEPTLTTGSHAVSSSGSEGKHKKIDVYDFGPLLPPPPAQPGAGDSAAVEPTLTTTSVTQGKAVVQVSTVRLVLAELLRGRDKTFHQPQHLLNRAFEREIHLLLQKESAKYQNNRVFLRTLERLRDPQQEVKFSEELSWPLKQVLGQAIPYNWLSREGMMEACSLIATEILEHLKPAVSFAEGTKSGDETLHSVNIPVKRDERETDRPLTQLELRHQKQCKESREEFCTTAGKDGAMATELKGKNKKKWYSWLCGLFCCKRT